MLKKKICKQCWNKGHEISGKRYGWNISDERSWKEGWIYCPPEYIEKEWIVYRNRRNITGEPPSKCPFLLEHII